MDVTERELTRRYVEQWRVTGELLQQQHDRELLDLTDEEALRISDILLSIPVERHARDECGLVEQQFWFQKLRSQ